MRLLNFLICIVVFTGGCDSKTKSEAPHTISDILNEFVASAPVQYLDLDDSPVQIISVKDEDIIYSTYDEPKSSKSKIGRIRDFIFFNDKFFIYDSFNSSVFRILKNGTVEGPYTSKGRGPGEHLLVTSLHNNSKHIYLPDWNNARINIYDEDMTLINEIEDFRGYIKTKYVDLNDEVLLFSNPDKTGFFSDTSNEGLIVVSRVNNPRDTLITILPQIIPNGYQPQVFNTPNFSINRKNEIAASYAPLPWIFLYDQTFNLKLTLVLDYSVFAEMDIPKMDFFKPIGNKGYGGAKPFIQFKLMDNGDMFISIGKELIYLSRIGNQQYKVRARYRFKIDGNESNLWVSDIYSSNNGNEFYAGNWDYLFRFALQ